MLFNLKEDPAENNNLIKSNLEQVKSLRDDLENYIAGLPKPRQAGGLQHVDKDTQEALKSLGYLE